jgi:hypothetical protein
MAQSVSLCLVQRIRQHVRRVVCHPQLLSLVAVPRGHLVATHVSSDRPRSPVVQVRRVWVCHSLLGLTRHIAHASISRVGQRWTLLQLGRYIGQGDGGGAHRALTTGSLPALLIGRCSARPLW